MFLNVDCASDFDMVVLFKLQRPDDVESREVTTGGATIALPFLEWLLHGISAGRTCGRPHRAAVPRRHTVWRTLPAPRHRSWNRWSSR